MTTEVRVPGATGELRAALALPAPSGPRPGVVVLHELLGLNDDVRVHTERVAAAGYVAVAPDLFSWASLPRCLVATLAELRAGRAGRALDDVRAVAAWLRARDDCTGRVGVIGFCMGGALAILLAPGGDFDVAAPNYGPVPADAERAMAGSCPVVASYGGRDRMLRGHAARLDAALDALGVDHDVKEYADAGHSFLSRHGPVVRGLGAALAVGYREAAADDAWRRMLTFLDRHLRDDRAG